MKRYRHDGELRYSTWFCGAGGDTQGAVAVPGVRPVHAANHWRRAIESHAANFPDVDHHMGDVQDIDVSTLPSSEIFWASPECTTWSKARGVSPDYVATDVALPGLEEPAPPEEIERSRALMEEVPQYLRAMNLRGTPVLAGVVENVVDIRDWTDFGRWRAEIEAEGYKSKVVALNSMFAQSEVMEWAPQSRDRFYLPYWHVSLGRDPDWDKWLRPKAWCPTCGEWVRAVQVFKNQGKDMGRYRAQYVYRCPRVTCRNQVVEPAYRPAYTAIDWTVRGERIGDRTRPLAEKTMRRIDEGIRRFARPIQVEAAGNTYDATNPRHPGHGHPDGYMRVWPLHQPLKTLHTTSSKAIAVPPMVVPVEGRDRKAATTVLNPLRTQSTRAETALLVAPFIAELRGGGSKARPISHAMSTVSAQGNHHGLTLPGHLDWDGWAAVYQYDTGGLRSLLDAMPTQTTIVGDALLEGLALPSVEDCLFRMLEPHEVLAGMAFGRDYIVLGNRRERVRQAGNAVTCNAAEILVSALVECITGQELERAA